MGVIRGVLLGLAIWLILGLIWLLGGCAPIIQVQPCECEKVQEWGDYPIGPYNPPTWDWTCPEGQQLYCDMGSCWCGNKIEFNDSPPAENQELFFYDGTTTMELPDNSTYIDTDELRRLLDEEESK